MKKSSSLRVSQPLLPEALLDSWTIVMSNANYLMKGLAVRSQRSYSLKFKGQVIEELLSGESRPAQLCRRYNITSRALYHWKRQYSQPSHRYL